MPRDSDEGALQAVKEAADIVEIVGEVVTLKKAGATYKGLCPFHGEKTPSFTVNPARHTFHCFGCGEGGDALAFVMRYQNIGFWEAVKQLAGRYHILLPERDLSPRERESASKRKALCAINQRAAAIYHQLLLTSPGAAPARDYLAKRGIPAPVIAAFQLGYAPEGWDFLLKQMADIGPESLAEAGLVVPRESGKGYYDRFRQRILFPIVSHSGQYLGFGGRSLGDQQPKYLNSPETLVFTKGRTLFGLFQNKEAIRLAREALVVEGNFDLLSLVAAGVKNVVAPLGTALTQQHVRALKGYAQVATLLFDGDQAGIKAAMRAVPLFLSEKVEARVVTLPDGHDPDTFINEFGVAELERRIAGADSLPEFVVSHLKEKHGLGLEGKGRILEELKPIIKAIDDQDLQRSLFVAHFSQTLGVTPERLQHGLATPQVISGQDYTVKPSPAPSARCTLTKSEEQLLSFLIINPEYVGRFIEAGLLAALTHPSAITIAQALQEALDQLPAGGAERLLDFVQGPERVFVSEQLIAAPSLPDTAREAAEKLQWLRENARKERMRELTVRINEAQRQNDQALLLSLLLEKKKINEAR